MNIYIIAMIGTSDQSCWLVEACLFFFYDCALGRTDLSYATVMSC